MIKRCSDRALIAFLLCVCVQSYAIKTDDPNQSQKGQDTKSPIVRVKKQMGYKDGNLATVFVLLEKKRQSELKCQEVMVSEAEVEGAQVTIPVCDY